MMGMILEFEYLDGEGVCIDGGIQQGQLVMMVFDLMFVKVIVYVLMCDDVVMRVKVVIQDLVLFGCEINVVFFVCIFGDEGFWSGKVYMGYFDENLWFVRGDEDIVVLWFFLVVVVLLICLICEVVDVILELYVEFGGWRN